MQKTLDLYNFDHGFVNEGMINIDEFKIVINSDHIKSLKLLERSATVHLENNIRLEPTVRIEDSVYGQYAITAQVVFDDEHIKPSQIYDDYQKNSNLDDLCALLSFLTGRIVFLQQQIENRPSLFKIDRATSNRVFVSEKLSLEPLNRIKEDGLSVALLNLCYAPSSKDLLALSAYSSCIFNVIYDQWCSKFAKTKYPNSELIKPVIDDAIKFIEERLTKSELNVIEDIVLRVKIDGSPSTIYKITAFLHGVGLIENLNDEKTKKNVKWLNTVRNSLVHKGGLPKDKEISSDRIAEICTSITFVGITIAQWYFASMYFNLASDVVVSIDQRELKEYFSSGNFRGKNVFSESYDEYMSRLIESWMAQG